jgi:hypothetical protein
MGGDSLGPCTRTTSTVAFPAKWAIPTDAVWVWVSSSGAWGYSHHEGWVGVEGTVSPPVSVTQHGLFRFITALYASVTWAVVSVATPRTPALASGATVYR